MEGVLASAGRGQFVKWNEEAGMSEQVAWACAIPICLRASYHIPANWPTIWCYGMPWHMATRFARYSLSAWCRGPPSTELAYAVCVRSDEDVQTVDGQGRAGLHSPLVCQTWPVRCAVLRSALFTRFRCISSRLRACATSRERLSGYIIPRAPLHATPALRGVRDWYRLCYYAVSGVDIGYAATRCPLLA
eukprot:3519774-Rhodomonas_salina.2